MPLFTFLLFATILAVLGEALKIPASTACAESLAQCPDAITVAETNFQVGTVSIHLAQLSCSESMDVQPNSGDGFTTKSLCDVLNTCPTVFDKTAAANTTVRNVSGIICSDSCNTLAGDLPPITEDCDEIKSAIVIFDGSDFTYFVVKPYHIMTLTYGTCRYFFQNFGEVNLKYDLHNLSSAASSAAAACFPPVMPINSEGLCRPADGTWAVGCVHSDALPSDD